MQTIADYQAAHGSMLAGQLYARGIEEAPGHIAPIRAEYRAISRAWHSCLRFRVFLGSRLTIAIPSSRCQPQLGTRSSTIPDKIVVEKCTSTRETLKRKERDDQDKLDQWFQHGLRFGKRATRRSVIDKLVSL